MAAGEPGDSFPEPEPEPEPEPAAPARKTEGEREQIKLQAAYVNGIAIGVFLVGGLSIPTSLIFNPHAGSAAAAIVAGLCFVFSPALHWVARRFLRELDR
ncbi:amino acid transporter protein [Jiella sp. M17.18]|uniref:amino acid transporter protein n=1 Tax=Jiella sp. M17.18 TaxID=3234247 RepID=UPI0034DEB433